MIRLVSDQCAALAFYGIDAENTLAGFYDIALAWFTDMGHPPDQIAIRGPGNPKGYQPFVHFHRRLKSADFEKVVSMELVSLAPEARIPGQDYLLTAWASLKNRDAYIVGRTSIIPLLKPNMLPLAKRIIQTTRPGYGIGYTRPHQLGPSVYAVGIVQGIGTPGERTPAEEAEAHRISHWGDGAAARVWEKGLLRDVYPWNFVSTHQLHARVSGVPLKEWIRRGGRGELEQLSEDLWFWELDPELIPAVREALDKGDLIFDWKKHVLSGTIPV
jgi:hypothetical protein